jgi:hypothetical protein
LIGPPPRLLLLVAPQLMLRPVLWLLPRRWRVLLFQLRL